MKRQTLAEASRREFGKWWRGRKTTGECSGSRLVFGGTNVHEFAQALGVPFQPNEDGSATPCPLSPQELQRLKEGLGV